jgi:hypothetical protein
MWRRYFFYGLLVAVLISCGGVASAQSQVGVYGTVGVESSGLNGQGWTGAGTIGAYFGLRDFGPLSVAADGRGDFSTDIASVLVGPRVAVHAPSFPVKPYGELLIGVVRSGPQNNRKSDFGYRFVGGADVGVLPHLDWRVIEVSSGGGLSEPNKTVHTTTVTSGVVLRF